MIMSICHKVRASNKSNIEVLPKMDLLIFHGLISIVRFTEGIIFIFQRSKGVCFILGRWLLFFSMKLGIQKGERKFNV